MFTGIVEEVGEIVDVTPQQDSARLRIRGPLVTSDARPGESHYRMADPEGNEFTVVLPLPSDVARKAYGPKGTPG